MSRVLRSCLLILGLLVIGLSIRPRRVAAGSGGEECNLGTCTNCASSCSQTDTACRNNCNASYNSCVNTGNNNCGGIAGSQCGGSVLSASYSPSNGCCTYQCAYGACAGTPPTPAPGFTCSCDTSTSTWLCFSPIIIDTTGNGFHLTNSENGVDFDFFGEGTKVKVAWPTASSGNGWLALDRNGNGTIDDGLELFGNMTEQPSTQGQPRNGFAALAVFDDPSNGGNGDGLIDNRDEVFSRLLLWIDANHDGISQPTELHPLSAYGISAINLHYTTSRRVDQFGNVFRFRSFLTDTHGAQDGRLVYDVFVQGDVMP